MQDASLCHEQCSKCWCREFLQLGPECRNMSIPDKIATTQKIIIPENGGITWTIFLIIGVCSFAFVVTIVAICICACRKISCFNCDKKHRNENPVPSER